MPVVTVVVPVLMRRSPFWEIDLQVALVEIFENHLIIHLARVSKTGREAAARNKDIFLNWCMYLNIGGEAIQPKQSEVVGFNDFVWGYCSLTLKHVSI